MISRRALTYPFTHVEYGYDERFTKHVSKNSKIQSAMARTSRRVEMVSYLGHDLDGA